VPREAAPPSGTSKSAAAQRHAASEAEDSAVVYRAVDFEHSVHLDEQGNILAGNGNLDDLASLAAYVCRLASLIGRQMSFGDVIGVETTLTNGSFFMNREKNGEVVCIKPREHLNLIQLRTQLNL
jgi:hypothetical protein